MDEIVHTFLIQKRLDSIKEAAGKERKEVEREKLVLLIKSNLLFIIYTN